MKNKFLVGLLVLAMCFAIVGCGKKPAENNTPSNIDNNNILDNFFNPYEYNIESNIRIEIEIIKTRGPPIRPEPRAAFYADLVL